MSSSNGKKPKSEAPVKNSAENIHSGHRERMRQRYLEGGFSGFSDHEIIEFLLFYSVRQINMNDTAHLLINRFRTLSAVFNADIDELMEVKGIGFNSALLLNMIPKLLAVYRKDLNVIKGEKCSAQMIKEFLLTHYLGKTNEHAVLLLFDYHMNMIDHVDFGAGTDQSCDLSLELIGEHVFKSNAKFFVIAHNHPNGTPDPSDEDKAVTNRICSIFNPLGKCLVEHYIVAGNQITGILNYEEYRK